MSFSDDSLKKLKQTALSLGADSTLALLDRLEAAEALLFTPIDNFDQREKLKEAWRKSAGK